MRKSLAAAIFIVMSLCILPQFSYSRAAQVYFGAYAKDISQFEQDANKKVSIIHSFQQWGGTNKSFDTASMDQVRGHGAIPLLSWEPWKGLSYGTTQPAYSLQNIIDGNFDAYITKFAQDAKAWQYPFFLRFAHEMNGDWYPWSEITNGNSPGQYVRAWKHVHDIFTSVGANNVSWVWCPGRVFGRGLSINDLPEMYPGDSYVDWVGMDGYNAGNDRLGWQSFSGVFSQLYDKILSITSRPIMIAETSCGEYGGQKDQWITDALSTQLSVNFTKVKGLVWFNDNNDPTASWEIESPPSAQAAFAKAIQSPYYASNNYYGIFQAPIPVPENVLGAPFGLLAPMGLPNSDVMTYIPDLGASWVRLNDYLDVDNSSNYKKYVNAGANILLNIRNADPSNVDSTYGGQGSWPNAGFPFLSKAVYQQDIRNALASFLPYLAKGTRLWVQCENEINDASNSPNSMYWRGTVDQYLLQLRTLYETVKSVDSTIPVVLSGFASTLLDAAIDPKDSRYASTTSLFTKLLSEGQYDAVDLHFYGCVEDIASKVRWIKDRLPAGKLWISSENGGPDYRCPSTPQTWDQDRTGFENLEAQQVVSRFSSCVANGGSICLWFTLFDPTGDAGAFSHLGLIDRSVSPPRMKPAYQSFRSFALPVLSVSNTGTGSGSVTSSPPGINCGPICSASYSAGTTVTLTAAANSGSTFTGWSGACQTASTNCVVTMSAAEAAAAHYLIAGTTSFSDVPVTSPFESYIEAIYDNGITLGCGNGSYCPSQGITREQMAAFIIRALYGETFSYTTAPYFSDVLATDYFFKYVQKLKELGITTGCGSSSYCPSQYVTRDQMAAFLVRATQVKAGEQPEGFTCSGDIDCSTTTPYFSDVPSANNFFKYIQKLKELGITVGCGNGDYCPSQAVTRDQMAAFISRAFLGMK